MAVPTRDELMRRYAPRLLFQEPVRADTRTPDQGPVEEPAPEATPTVDPAEQPHQAPVAQPPAPVPPAAQTPETARLQVQERPTAPQVALTGSVTAMPGILTVPTTSSTIAWNPVVTTAGAKTIITAPAAAVPATGAWASAPNPSPHMLWMQGRFVGADRPNRNGALWASADLEMGRPTVTHGPLNWLHQDRHIIGTIADARFVPGAAVTQAAVTPSADAIPDPHIAALAGIWRWVYPEEASVVEMASDAGVLAYSMECISESVECAGDAGCGKQYGYLEFAKGETCDHLQQRASIRRLVNPTFLGGAVIVPPSRPGWADANAHVMRAASKMAEKAYEDAGRPDMPAATWESLMGQVLTFAGVIE